MGRVGRAGAGGVKVIAKVIAINIVPQEDRGVPEEVIFLADDHGQS